MSSISSYVSNIKYFIFSNFDLNIICTSVFTKSLSFLKSTGTGTNLSTYNLSTLFFKLLILLGTCFNLSIPNLYTSDFKLAKSTFLAKSEGQLTL